MIKMLSVDERTRLVCSSDTSVSLDIDEVRWVPESGQKCRKGVFVAEVRPLNSREFLRLQGEVSASSSPEIEIVIRAAEVGLCAVEVDGQRDEGAADLARWIDRLPPAELSSLGAYVINTTLIGDDERPT